MMLAAQAPRNEKERSALAGLLGHESVVDGREDGQVVSKGHLLVVASLARRRRRWRMVGGGRSVTMLGLVGGAPGKTPRVADSSAHWCRVFQDILRVDTLNMTSRSTRR